MIRFASLFTVASLSGLATALAHPTALEHAHPHEPAGLFTAETLVAVGIGLAIGAAFAFVRQNKGE